jgi:hypothetical protein
MTDRIVPGMPMMPVIVPEGWSRAEFEIPRTPPSMNTNAIRSHWRGFHREKKAWEDEIGFMLMAALLPRLGERAIAGCKMRFPRRGRRDSGNFKGVVEKALGDALVAGGWIPDDDAARYVFVGVEFEDETGPNRTTIVVFTQPAGRQ